MPSLRYGRSTDRSVFKSNEPAFQIPAKRFGSMVGGRLFEKKLFIHSKYLHTKIHTINTVRLSCIKSLFHRPQLSPYTASCNMAGGKDQWVNAQCMERNHIPSHKIIATRETEWRLSGQRRKLYVWQNIPNSRRRPQGAQLYKPAGMLALSANKYLTHAHSALGSKDCNVNCGVTVDRSCDIDKTRRILRLLKRE
jgi:hypothetical protein